MLVDTHCHLTSAGLVERLDEVLAAARQAGVQQLITVAQNLADTEAALDLAGSHENIYLAAAIHPHESNRCDLGTFEALTELLRDPAQSLAAGGRLVAVGETGLDFHYDFSPPARQQEVFLAHLHVAQEAGLPVVIHAREAERRTCEILKAEFPNLAERAVFHCYSGDPNLTRGVLDLGAHVSFTGVVTFRKAESIQAAAQIVPSDRIMVETDAPFLSPEPVRNVRPCEPALVVHTARFLAELRDTDFDTFAAQTTLNARRFFGLPEV